MNELITIKGNSSGLRLVIDKRADFRQVRQALSAKLAASAKFFIKNTEITLADSSFSSHEHVILKELLEQYHLTLKLDSGRMSSAAPPAKAAPEALPDKVIQRTIRGGEEIIYKGSIVVYGNVNPGASVVSGGNINIHGRCLGVVHAGAFGNHDAFVVADRLAPPQIRIADFIACSPDDAGEAKAADSPEIAYIKDGNIILEPFDRDR